MKMRTNVSCLENIIAEGDEVCFTEKTNIDSRNNSDTLLSEIKSNQNKILNETKNLKRQKRFSCPYQDCQCKFGKNIRLKAHIRTKHTGYMPFLCSFDGCRASFACQTYLNKHLLRHEKPKKNKSKKQYKCDECNTKEESITFSSKKLLRFHLSSIHGQSPFNCDKCSSGFMTRAKLTAHQRRHRGYKCSYDGCEFSVDKWSELRRHLASEHRKLECIVCLKTYSSSYNLRIHEQTVHKTLNVNEEDSGKYLCMVSGCQRSYQRESSLKTHMRTVHCEPRHNCAVCSKKFRHKKSLMAHSNLAHNNQSAKTSIKLNLKKRKTSSSTKTLTESKLKKAVRLKPMIDTSCFNEIDHEIFEHCDNELSSSSSIITDDKFLEQKVDNEKGKLFIKDFAKSSFIETIDY